MSEEIKLQVGVKVLLRNKDGRYLLIHRAAKAYPGVIELWDIVGGRIEAGVPLFENLKREVFEETGLELLDEPKLLAAQDILRMPGKHVVRLTYVGTIDGDVKIDNEEQDDYGWFTIDEIKNLEGIDSYLLQVLNTVLL